MIREWLCRHGWHHWTPNNLGGSRPWCNWGAHWHEGWVFCKPCKSYYPRGSAHAMSVRSPSNTRSEEGTK